VRAEVSPRKKKKYSPKKKYVPREMIVDSPTKSDFSTPRGSPRKMKNLQAKGNVD
jgi:hypothetical protein